MAKHKTLDTPKGPLQIEIRHTQMVESNSKKLIEMTVANIQEKFFMKTEFRIPWDQDEPDTEDVEGFEKKCAAIFNRKPLKELGYEGKL
jgi:hypothetical protein